MLRLVAWSAVVLCALAACDGVLIFFDLFPPVRTFGDEIVGFRDQEARGAPYVIQSTHWRFAHSDSGAIAINEMGFRSTRSIEDVSRRPARYEAAVVGDSHTDLPFANRYLHSFVLEERLRERGYDFEVLSAGQGGYSPVQDILFFQHHLTQYHPTILLVDLYTGNDIFDMMRIDDRPTLEMAAGGEYEIVPPRWYRFDDPRSRSSVFNKSRVLFAGEEFLRATGLWRGAMRLRYLTEMAHANGGGVSEAITYMLQLAKCREDGLSYPPAYASQVLNQYLFFSSFPKAKAEALNRLSFLFSTVRRTYPTMTLVVSMIPSAVLTMSLSQDSLFLRKLTALGLTYGAVADQEQELSDSVKAISMRAGWTCIENAPAMVRSRASGLFMAEDLHLSPTGSEIVGDQEAERFADLLGEPGGRLAR